MRMLKNVFLFARKKPISLRFLFPLIPFLVINTSSSAVFFYCLNNGLIFVVGRVKPENVHIGARLGNEKKSI